MKLRIEGPRAILAVHLATGEDTGIVPEAMVRRMSATLKVSY